MLIPAENVYAKVVSAPVGLWPAPIQDGGAVLVSKLTTDTIKAIYQGAPTFLIASVVALDSNFIRCVGLKICDDPIHPITPFGPHTENDDIRWLEWLLNQPSTHIYFYDEVARPVLDGVCRFENADEAREAAVALQKSGVAYSGSDIDLLNRAMDVFEGRIDGKSPNTLGSVRTFQLRLLFSNLNPMTVAWPGAGEFVLDSPDEGDGLEQSVRHLLEIVFPMPGTLFRKPQVPKNSGTRELTDVLGLEPEVLFLLETKALSVFNKHPDQPTERRIKNVMAQVKKGFTQLEGAIRKLRSGTAVTTMEKSVIPIDMAAKRCIHTVVLISSMSLDLDWKWITRQILALSQQHNVFFHVLDLMELQQLAVRAKTAHRFHLFLCKRLEMIIDTRNANTRVTFLDEFENNG